MRALAIQRCSCGGECPRCRAKRHGRSLVERTLREPGRPLEPGIRSGFETALGHDFGRVRVHTGPTASESAAAVGARAYTVGANVVFAAGRYDQGSAEGQQLLAHELTHVRQQEGAARSGPLRIVDDSTAEAEADRSSRTISRRIPVAVQRQPEGPRLLPETRLRPPPPPMLFPPGSIRETYILPAPPDIKLEPSTLVQPRERFPRVLDTPLVGPPPFTPAIYISVSRCVPGGGLSWGDFQGTPPGGTFAAFTSVPIREENVQGNVMFRAVLNNSASWVRPHVRGAGARATNRCAPLVAQCQQDLRRLGPGATWDRTPPAGCAASPFTTARATTVPECDSVVGAACDADAQADSERILRHEQGHFDITCKLVGRADDALAAGTPLASVRTWLNANAQPQNTNYDGDTSNGCDAGQQAAWETAIANNLPAVAGP